MLNGTWASVRDNNASWHDTKRKREVERCGLCHSGWWLRFLLFLCYTTAVTDCSSVGKWVHKVPHFGNFSVFVLTVGSAEPSLCELHTHKLWKLLPTKEKREVTAAARQPWGEICSISSSSAGCALQKCDRVPVSQFLSQSLCNTQPIVIPVTEHKYTHAQVFSSKNEGGFS